MARKIVEVLSGLKVAVIGAGMSGLFMGHYLREAGANFTIYEKRDGAGGTWHANTYPGLHVDTITRSYEFPFARSNKWSKRYAPGSEVREYLGTFPERDGLTPYIRYNTEVVGAEYSEHGWTVTLADGTSSLYDIVVAASGFLRVPKRPRVTGSDSFEGPSFHSSEWDHGIDYATQRVGVIGTGSSGVQITTALGEQGVQVTQFIRTPQWMMVKPNPAITPVEKILLRVPFLASYWDKRVKTLRAKTEGGETWRLEPGPEREEMNGRFQQMLVDNIPDPELRRKFTPDEPPGVKRIAKTTNYYQIAQQDNVHLVFDGIERVEPNGIVDSHGDFHELDVLIWATGFDAHSYARPINVQGLQGITLDEAWSEGVTSYRGIAVPGFPNFFMLNGPFAPVQSVAIPLCLVDEVGYLMRLFETIVRSRKAYAPTAEATEDFLSEIREALPNTTFSQGDNWYSQKVGTPIIWPFTRQAHTDQFIDLHLEDYDAYPLASGLTEAEHSS